MKNTTFAAIASFALMIAVPALANDHAKNNKANEDRTGFTDGQNTPAGTNVVTGQETTPSGAQSGVKRKNKKAKPHVDTDASHAADAATGKESKTANPNP